MKDGRTHLAHKPEEAVSPKDWAVPAVTLKGAGAGDTTTLAEAVIGTADQLVPVAEKTSERTVGGRRARRDPSKAIPGAPAIPNLRRGAINDWTDAAGHGAVLAMDPASGEPV